MKISEVNLFERIWFYYMEQVSGNCSQSCLWYGHCRSLKPCDDYTPLVENHDFTDAELYELKIAFRREFLEYAREEDLLNGFVSEWI